jgi:hypothetical protein
MCAGWVAPGGLDGQPDVVAVGVEHGARLAAVRAASRLFVDDVAGGGELGGELIDGVGGAQRKHERRGAWLADLLAAVTLGTFDELEVDPQKSSRIPHLSPDPGYIGETSAPSRAP